LVVEDGDIRILYDGNTPTDTNGRLLSSGNVYYERGVPLNQVKLIRVSGNVVCSVEVGRSDISESSSSSAYNVTLEASSVVIGDVVADITKVNGTTHSATNPLFVKEVSAGTDIVVLNATNTTAINTTTAIAAEWKLLQVVCHFSSAPVASESFILKLDSIAGAAYDTTLYSVNPSLSAATDLVYTPDSDMKFKVGDELNVTFTNTNANTYGLSIYYQLV
jgi:hypothetical protein